MLKKIFSILFFICIALTLSGCFGGLEVNDRAFVQLMGIEHTDEVYIVSLQIYKSESGTPDPDVSKANSVTVNGSGATIQAALSDAEISLGKKLFLGHIKMLIIGSGIENPADELSLFLDGSVSPSCPVAYSDNPRAAAETLLEDGTFSAEQLLKLMETSASQGRTLYTSVADIASKTGIENTAAALPCIVSDGETIHFQGMTFARRNGTAGYLAEEDVQGVKLLTDSFEKGDRITVPIIAGEDLSTAYITDSKACLKTEFTDDGKLRICADVCIKIKTDENPFGSNEKIIEAAVRESVKDTCISAFSTAVWYNSCDIFDIKKLIRRDCPDFYGEYCENEEGYLRESILTVNVVSRM